MFRIWREQRPHQHMMGFHAAGNVEKDTRPRALRRQFVLGPGLLAYMEKGSLSGYLQPRPRSAHFAHVGRAESHRVLLTRHASQAARILVCDGMSLGRFLFFVLYASRALLRCGCGLMLLLFVSILLDCCSSSFFFSVLSCLGKISASSTTGLGRLHPRDTREE